jgi:uncharacterized protein YecE (DUF72 family)
MSTRRRWPLNSSLQGPFLEAMERDGGLNGVHIGTSGWVYPGWNGAFYPTGLPQKRWLEYYTSTFDTAEINATFYRLPTQAAVARWREAAPPNLLFSWKASRFVTHMKRLRDVEASLERVLAPMRALGPTLGPALFQLPPSLKVDLSRLQDFLAMLPRDLQSVLEFRDPSWYVDAVYEALAAHDATLCVSDHHHAPAPWVATTNTVYVRGHGPEGAYAGVYPAATLSAWAERLATWRREGRVIFAYFDNDIGCAAPGDALRLRRSLVDALG